jgi:dihydroceramidase
LEVTAYIAEFWNTTSNAFGIVAGLFGVLTCLNQKLPVQFALCHAALACVGIGSALFHGTLQWQSQLLDELPMVWGSCIFIYAIATDAAKVKAGLLFPLALFIFAAAVTHHYTSTWDFEFFTSCYGLQVAVLVLMSIYHNRTASAPLTPVLTRLLLLSLAWYFSGFLVWNIDNGMCRGLKDLRSALPSMMVRTFCSTRVSASRWLALLYPGLLPFVQRCRFLLDFLTGWDRDPAVGGGGGGGGGGVCGGGTLT